MLQAICALSEAEGIERVIPFLKDPEPIVRRGALVGLLRHCGIDGVLAGGSHLSGLIGSLEPAERVLAAQVLGDIGIASYYRPLLALLRDPMASVRLAAIEAARQLRPAGAVAPVLESLKVPSLRAAASATLVEIGDAALPQLESAFVVASCPREIRRSIARICGRLRTPKAAAFLKRHLTHPDGPTRTDVLAALVHCREKLGTHEMTEARELILREAGDAAWALGAWKDINTDPSLADLARAFLAEIDERKQRIFLLLALVYSPAVIRKARLDLETRAGEKRAHALEVLDNLLAPELKRNIFPLLDNLSPHERHKLFEAVFPQPRLDATARLHETLGDTNSKASAWTRACALLAVGKSRAAKWSEAAVAALSDREEVVRETAVWSLARVNAPAFRTCAEPLTRDANPAIARLSRHLLNETIPDAAYH